MESLRLKAVKQSITLAATSVEYFNSRNPTQPINTMIMTEVDIEFY